MTRTGGRTAIWQVAWSNPRKERPDGFPEVILEIQVPLAPGQGCGDTPSDIHEAWEEMRPYGYGIRACVDKPPARQLPLESKQRIRRRNLWKRLLKRYPLFASDFYAERVKAYPDHYGPYLPGEFADVAFARTTLGNLKQLKETT